MSSNRLRPSVVRRSPLVGDRSGFNLTASDKKIIAETIEWDVLRHNIVLPIDKFTERLSTTLNHTPIEQFKRLSGERLTGLIDNILSWPESPICMIGHKEFIGVRQRLSAIKDIILDVGEHDRTGDRADIGKVIYNMRYDPVSDAYDLTSSDGLEGFLSDLRSLVEAGLLENDNYQLRLLVSLC